MSVGARSTSSKVSNTYPLRVYAVQGDEMRFAEYVQRLDYLPFPLSELDSRLNSRPIREWSWIVHDKDTYEDGTLKPPHIHVEMKFNTDQGVDNVCKWFDDKPERIERGKSDNKSFMWENMNMYIIHDTKTAIEGEKYPYPIEEVHSNFDYESLIEKARQGIKEAKEKRKSHPLAEVLQKICNNEIPKIKISEYVTDLDRIKFQRDINAAYAIRDEKLAREVDRDMDIMYFYGPTGVGKSSVAKYFARQMKYDIFICGSGNDPFQGYIGQECIIYNDIRGDEWTYSDLLRMLDPYNNSLVRRRYSNVSLNDCKLMILTAPYDVPTLYNNLKKGSDDPADQLYRRLRTEIKFTKELMTSYRYSEGEGEYLFDEEQVNPFLFMEFTVKNESYVDNMFNMASDMAKKKGFTFPREEMEQLRPRKVDIAPNEEDLPFDDGSEQMEF